ncbi:MAG: lysophospholipid acyltransferase family protein [Anaerolineae bacterium]
MRKPYRPPAYVFITRPLLRGVARLLFRMFGLVEIHGLENVPRRGAYLVAVNHISVYDPPFVLAFWPRTLDAIGAIDVFERPLQGQLLRLYGTIPVHRGEYDRALIEKMLDLLRAGRAVMIAPEGGRSHEPAMRRAKPGIGFLLQQANVPVVPVGVTGTMDDYLQRVLRGERPALGMWVGRPILLPPPPANAQERRAARQQIADLVMSHIAGLLPEEYRGAYAGSAIFPAQAD